MQLPITSINFIGATLFGLASAYLAHRRGKNPYLWFIIGFALGGIGIFAFLFFNPKKKRPTSNEKQSIPVLTIDGPKNKFWYYLDLAHQQKGPMSYVALTKALREGKIGPSTYVWHEEMGDWKELKESLKREPQPI